MTFFFSWREFFTARAMRRTHATQLEALTHPGTCPTLELVSLFCLSGICCIMIRVMNTVGVRGGFFFLSSGNWVIMNYEATSQYKSLLLNFSTEIMQAQNTAKKACRHKILHKIIAGTIYYYDYSRLWIMNSLNIAAVLLFFFSLHITWKFSH